MLLIWKDWEVATYAATYDYCDVCLRCVLCLLYLSGIYCTLKKYAQESGNEAATRMA